MSDNTKTSSKQSDKKRNRQGGSRGGKSSGSTKRLWALAAFAIPLISLLIICGEKGVYPFGDQVILQSDMYHQYCPFFYRLWDHLHNGGSALYDWNLGLGSDFIATYGYYLASPVNFLLFFCPQGLIIEFMTYTILLRIAFASLFFYLLLTYRFEIAQEDNGANAAALALSCIYAMSGYVAAYNWQIMWMDGIMLTPLIFLGLWKMQREGKSFLYYVTLALAIWSNYYIALMICIFLVFYFALLWLENREGRLLFTLRFGVFSLLAGGTGALIILPTAAALSVSGADVAAFPQKIEWYFNVLEEISRGNAFASIYVEEKNWPNLYAGVFTLLLAALYFMNRQISWKKKAPRLFMILFFLISFANNILTFLWHGFRYPTFFPARQAFLYIAVLVLIAMDGFLHRKDNRKWHIFAAGIVYILLTGLSAAATDKEVTSAFSFYVTAGVLVAYLILYGLYQVVDAGTKQFLAKVLVVIALLEGILGMRETSFWTGNRSEVLDTRAGYMQVLDKIEDDGFWRVENLNFMSRNDGSFMGYSSASAFNTMMNMGVADFYHYLFLQSTNRYYGYNGATPLVSALLGVKYEISRDELPGTAYRTLMEQADGLWLYRNSFVPAFGYFLVGEDLGEDWAVRPPMENLNALTQMLTGEKAFSDSYAHQEILPGRTTITVHENGHFYAFYGETMADRIRVEAPDKRAREYYDTGNMFLLEIGYLEEGESAAIDNNRQEEMPYRILRMDEQVIGRAWEKLTETPFELTGMGDADVTGKITVPQKGKLVFSVPADPGWSILVDGTAAESGSFRNALLAVELTEGEHRISLQYHTPYRKEGLVITLICLLSALVLLTWEKIKKQL